MRTTPTESHPFASTNHLPFEAAPWVRPDFIRFRIGTCEGLWRCVADAYEILAINNNQPGNGHLQDVFDWFEYACRRDNRNLRILELLNYRFAQHLVAKRGFTVLGQTATKRITND